MSRITFLCCHLSGTGHLVRTLRLARTARARGHEVTVISGGRALSHVESGDVPMVQLPPLIVRDLDFSTCWTPEGVKATPAYMTGRRTALSTAIKKANPDVLVTELWPFGRRALAEEFREAIKAAQRVDPLPRPGIICSVRDVPEPKPKRQAEVARTLREHFDGVLVHGDAAFLPLWQTWPGVERWSPPIRHTGYIATPMPVSETRANNVLVSVGGGPLGRNMLEAAAAAASLSSNPWHLLVGGADAAQTAQLLRARHGQANLTIEPTRPDYRHLLASAGCSISLCGYNTAVELAGCLTPALLIPEQGGGEHEQTIRADRLGSYPGISVLAPSDVTPQRLAKAADTLVGGPRRRPIPLRMDDGTAAMKQLEQMLIDTQGDA